MTVLPPTPPSRPPPRATLHFVAAAEPVPRYCRQVRLWAWSLRRRAGVFAGEPITVTFNGTADAATARRLETDLQARVCVRPRLFADHREANKYNALFAPGLNAADWVVLTDCDVVCAAALDALPERLGGAAFGAVSDGVPPAPRRRGRRRPVSRYERLLRDLAGLDPSALARHRHPDFDRQPPYTGYPYFNGGVLAIRGRVLPAFRETVIRLTRAIHNHVRPAPARLDRCLVRAWNDLWYRRPAADRLSIGWHLRPRYADQAALLPAVLALGLPYRVLPHAFNWRFAAMGGAAEPPRLLHYYEQALGLPPSALFDRRWIPVFGADRDPGRRALADVVAAYLDAFPQDTEPPAGAAPHRACVPAAAW